MAAIHSPDSSGRLIRRAQELHVEAIDLLDCPPGDALHVADHADGRADRYGNLLLALGPLLGHELAFAVEILAHVVELLDQRRDAMAKLRPGQVLIDHLGLGLLALTRL